ncbi:MAG: HNH endonuclease [Gammaproteobacteria bacterium]
MEIATLEAQITELVGHLNSANHRLLTLRSRASQTLRDGCDGRCEHAHGPSLAVETALRLGCDASVVAVVKDQNGEPLNVGRKTRTIPPAIRRALFARDKDGCRFPGCTNRHYVDGHHIKHWANGGETRLSNLVLLCRFHHRQVHEGSVEVQVLDDGALRTPDTGVTRWRGERMDYGTAVDLMLSRMRRAASAGGVSAETR